MPIVSFIVHSPSSGLFKTINLDLTIAADQLRPAAERALEIAKREAGVPDDPDAPPESFNAIETYRDIPIFRHDDFIRGMEVNGVEQPDDFNNWDKEDVVSVFLSSTETREYKMGEIQRQEEIIVEQGDRINELERIIVEQGNRINALEAQLILLQQQNETLEKEKSTLNHTEFMIQQE